MDFRTGMIAVLVLLAVGCSGDDDEPSGGSDSSGGSSRVRILQLRDANISEADFKIHLISAFAAVPATKDLLCGYVRNLSFEEFVVALTEEEGSERTPMRNETPVPGQKSDKRSQERVHAIVKELCES
jgi:hypothetical protein